MHLAAGDPMARTQLAQFRPNLFAAFDGKWAPWMKNATGGGGYRARDFAPHGPEFAIHLDTRIGHWHRRQKRLRVRVERVVEQLVTIREFDDPTEIHDRHALA